MKQQPAITHDDSLLAVAERVGGSTRVLLVRKGPRPAVVDRADFSARDEGALADWLDQKLCRDLRMILPAASVVVRSTTLPAASHSQMMTALALQAESVFLGNVPRQRLGLAVLSEGMGTERRGMVIAWPVNQVANQLADPLAPELIPRLESITSYLPEPAALMPLAGSDLPAVVADRTSGSIAIALRSPSGMVLRSAREDGVSDEVGLGLVNEGLRRAIAETALNAGVEPSKIAALVAGAEAAAETIGDRIIVLDPDIRGLLGGRISVELPEHSLDPAWWRSNAVLLGGAVAACGPLEGLCALRRREKASEPTRLVRLITRYSEPTRAVRVVAAAVVIAAVAPIASAWLSLQVYLWKMPTELGEFQAQQVDIEQRIEHYEALMTKTLPATKLLGDLAVATPDGIEIESIQLSLTQGVSVRGVAKTQGGKSPDEIVNLMARQMDASGVFRKTSWNWSTPDGRNVFKFSLNADLADKTRMPEYDETRDWSVKTLAQRKYPDPTAGKTSTPKASDGEPAAAPESRASTDSGPSGATVPNGPKADAGGERAPAGAVADAAKPAPDGSQPLPDRGIGRRPGSETNGAPKPPAAGGAGTGAGGGPGAIAKANLVIPDPISDDQLKAMTKPELRERLKVFAEARKREDLDPETKQRMNTDFNRLLDALKAANN